MTPHDAVLLSRLLSGDLDPDAEAQLRQRIAGDPALADALDQQARLIIDLDALPAELDGDLPPVAALAPGRPAPSPRAAPWPALLGAGLAAAGLLLALRPQAPTHLSLSGHETIVDGRLALDLPDHTTVTIDGRTGLSLTAPAEAPSTSPQAEPTMIRQALAGAAAGSLLTVAVYEGRAHISAPDQDPQDLRAGDTRELAVPGASAGNHSRAAAAADSRLPRTLPATAPSDLAAEIQRLQDENEQLRLENALVRGNLAAHEGSPMPWPDDLPATLRPEGFEASAAAAAEAIDGVDLVDIDCSEFPCIGVLHGVNADPGWEQDAAGVAEAIADGLGEGYGVVAMGRGEDDGSGPVMLLGFSIVPEGYDPEADGVRLGYRSEELMGTVADEIREGPDVSE